MYYIGLDLGTSGLKGILVDESGNIQSMASESYEVSYPHDGWAEQNPLDWLQACKKVIAKLAEGRENSISGLSIAGQMHGLVILDDKDEVIRPCILWNDGRTGKQTEYLNEVVGKKKLSELTANIAYAGFTAPKLLWLKENEPENFARISKIMLPKDYLAYMLTGAHSTDYSDASGTLLLDVKNKRWSQEMCEICSVNEKWLPKLYESYEVVGKIKNNYNLPKAVVCAGAGDNAAAAVGTGTVKNGDCNISLGTSGTVFISCDEFFAIKDNALHSFAHATGKWHLMGCILSAASCNKWWLDDILETTDYSCFDSKMSDKIGDNTIYFLPYLMGERSPHNDVDARGAFIGLSPTTTKEDMSLAVLEGVAFALRDCIEVARQNGLVITKANICGGGAKSELWKTIIANVLNLEVHTGKTEQGPSYGAAMLAMVGCGKYATLDDCVSHLSASVDKIYPDKIPVEKYQKRYETYRTLYPSLKQVFNKMSKD